MKKQAGWFSNTYLPTLMELSHARVPLYNRDKVLAELKRRHYKDVLKFLSKMTPEAYKKTIDLTRGFIKDMEAP